jgi:hypothetical protein
VLVLCIGIDTSLVRITVQRNYNSKESITLKLKHCSLLTEYLNFPQHPSPTAVLACRFMHRVNFIMIEKQTGMKVTFVYKYMLQKLEARLKKKLHGLSPRANYTDRATAACQRSDCQLVRIEGATWSAWRIPPAVFLSFLDRSHYFSIK